MVERELPAAAIWFIKYLQPALAASGMSVPVRGEVPSTRPAAFVKVQVAGGASSTLVTGSTQLLVESWHSTTPSAERLAARVDALARLAPGNVVGGVQCLGFIEYGLPYDSPDPESRSPRFRQTLGLIFRRSI